MRERARKIFSLTEIMSINEARKIDARSHVKNFYYSIALYLLEVRSSLAPISPDQFSEIELAQLVNLKLLLY